jgi:tetrapyrrole methylase family protein/MazG family protein
VYAVPAPIGRQVTVPALRRAAASAGLAFESSPAFFLEPSLAALGPMPSTACKCDALDLAARHHPPLSPDRPALIGQVYSAVVASDVKLTLLNAYPDDHPVVLLHGAGTGEAVLERVSLHESTAARPSACAHRYVPPPTAARLILPGNRCPPAAPDGCPWIANRPSAAGASPDGSEASASRADADDMPGLRRVTTCCSIVLQAQIAGKATSR